MTEHTALSQMMELLPRFLNYSGPTSDQLVLEAQALYLCSEYWTLRGSELFWITKMALFLYAKAEDKEDRREASRLAKLAYRLYHGHEYQNPSNND